MQWPLDIHSVDLHLHAGTERPPDMSLNEYIRLAWATGRRILGLTDHFGRFLGQSRKPLRHYPGTLDGLHTYVREIEEARERFPDMLILFAPEMGPEHLLSDETLSIVAEPFVDYILIETGSPLLAEKGNVCIEGMRVVARNRDRTGIPGITVHPLRWAVNELSAPELAGSTDDIEELFGVDMNALADASKRYDVPIELNGETWKRLGLRRAAWLTDRYLEFYRVLIDLGAEISPGTDQHGPAPEGEWRHGAADRLGLDTIPPFLRHWISS
jgi:histidinol phosphatase-like PHP family hydrolase